MEKYKCLLCKKNFSEKEYQISNDKKRCVLHCKKDNWYDITDNNTKKWSKSNNKINFFWLKLDKKINRTKNEICTLSNIVFPVFFIKNNFTFNYSVKKNLNITSCTFLSKIVFRNTIFDGIITLWSQNKFYEPIEFHYCHFENEIYFVINNKNSKIKKSEFKLLTDGSIFNKAVYLDNQDFTNCTIDFKNTTFNHLVDFKSTTFDNVSFDNTKFNNTTIFTDTIFKKTLNLRNAIFTDEVNFLDIKLEDKNNIIENQETARIIKYNFEKIGNKIEANKYHTLELEQRKIELEKDKWKNFREYIVFKIHHLSSEHSTNWILVLLWIVTVGFLTNILNNKKLWCLDFPIAISLTIFFIVSIFLISHKYLKVGTFITVCSILLIFDNHMFIQDIIKNMSLINLTNSEVIFIGSSSDKLTPWESIVMFFNKISLGYLYYQFLTAVRKDTRK